MAVQPPAQQYRKLPGSRRALRGIRGPVAAFAGAAVVASALLVAQPAGAAPATAGTAAAAVTPAATSAAAPAADDLTHWVNPFVGTQNFGNTFPGASAPFGMVQVSPDTGGQGGYDYLQNKIYGFSQTHLSGVGCGVVGELPVMPTTGAVNSVDTNSYGSQFSHDNEQATPGYYQVGLVKYGINAELTATDRTGWQRYTFPADKQANVLFNTGKANMTVFDSEVHVVGDHTIEGRIHDGNFCAGKDQHTVYFSAQFDTPFAGFGTWSGSTITADNRDASTKNGGNGAYVTFPAGTTSATLKVGLSYTGVEGARKNLAAETNDSFDFDATRTALTTQWNDELHKAAITGGSDDRRTAYYTSLYHSLLHPNLAGDVDGRYLGWDGELHTAADYTPRQNFSLWDTYRPQNQLTEILAPDVARDDYLSLLAIGEEGGWLPRWALVNSETNIMTGDPVTPFLVEGWSKGFLAGHEEQAYALLRKNATGLPPAESQYNGRSGQQYYQELGYIPFGLDVGTDCVSHGGDNDCDHPASATMEYSAADAALSLMAKGLGHAKDAKLFAERGRWYSNLWDQQTKTFRPRLADGNWLAPYDPIEASHAFHEGGSYQYQWLVPQDPAGLVKLMGGTAKAQQRLDDFFAYDHLLSDPAKTVKDDWISEPYDYYAKATYNPNNEPDLLAPYMYAYVQQPAKIATVARAAFGLFTTGPDGMTGNDDLGTMSAWYVFSSWGMYPTMSGGNFFVLSSPQFDKVSVQVGAAKNGAAVQGGTLTITAPEVSDQNRYVQSVKVNGHKSSATWIDWAAIARGGSLGYTVGDTPSAWGTAKKDSPPSIDATAKNSISALSATVTPNPVVLPTTARSTKLTVSMVGQAPGSLAVTVRAQAPAGWKVTPGTVGTVLSSKGIPASKDVRLALTLPTDVKPGSYLLTVTVKAAGVGTVTKRVTIQIKEPLACAAATDGTCGLDLSGEYTNDGTATVAAPSQGNFDLSGWAYDADLLPAAGAKSVDGVTYDLPDATGTAKNFVEAKGQSLLLPSSKYAALHLLGAAHNGDVSSALVVTYTDGTVDQLPVTMTDWAAGSGHGGNTVVFDMDHRIKNGSGVDGPPVQIFGATVPLDPSKAVVSVQLPNSPNMELYAITAG
ncbi:GH92 family glycosyl hydrolase [Nakamurella lactea]|uniref:GH92 family glycosyl hydrolase n=1 Tax=Nakamurella lactea TaxID=459515 RepID=UPI0003F5E8EA|nr:GH92 family glycosyl hydrolase [Nakamurella lactea]